METYYIFILSSRHGRYLNIDVCADLRRGVRRRRARTNRQLGRRRVLQKLVYVEAVRDVDAAVARACKLALMSRRCLGRVIDELNPGREALSTRTFEEQERA